MQGLLSTLWLFHNKFNNTGARMLDSILLYDIRYSNLHFWPEKVKIMALCKQHYYGRHFITLPKSIN